MCRVGLCSVKKIRCLCVVLDAFLLLLLFYCFIFLAFGMNDLFAHVLFLFFFSVRVSVYVLSLPEFLDSSC